MLRFVALETEWPLQGIGKAKVQIRFEAKPKDKSPGKHDVVVGENKGIVEAKLKRGAAELSSKFNQSLLAMKERLLEGGDVTFANVPIALRVEAKFLDATLTLDDLKLDAVKITVIGEGDFSQAPFVPDHLKLVGQLRVEVAVDSELVHDLYKLGAATQELKRGAEIQEKLKEGKRALADRNAKAAKLRATKGGPTRPQLEKLKVLEAEIKELEGKTGKLEQLRAGAAKTRDAAIQVVKDIGGKLGKTKLGSFLARHVAKAVAFAFKKVLPVYNVISTAVDLAEIAEHLMKTTELGNESGGGVAGGKSQADEQGQGTGSGAGSGAGSGGSGEAPTGEDKGVGTADGSGGASIESAKPDAPMPDLGTAGLEPTGAVQLTKSAELVMRTLLKQQVYAPSQTLDDEQKAIINAVVPADLDADELVALAKIMSSKSGAMTPIPQLVIEAIQQVRPDGKKRRPLRAKPPVPTTKTTAPLPKPLPSGRARLPREEHEPIDLERYVHDHAKIDMRTRAVTLPKEVELEGVTLEMQGIAGGMNLGSEESYLLRAVFVVKKLDGEQPRHFNDGVPVSLGTQRIVIVSKRMP